MRITLHIIYVLRFQGRPELLSVAMRKGDRMLAQSSDGRGIRVEEKYLYHITIYVTL